MDIVSPSSNASNQLKSEDLEVDEMGTIHLIESLDEDAKRVLNSLVQSVLLSS